MSSLPISNNILKTRAIGYADSKSPLVCKEIEIPVSAQEIVKPTELLVHVKNTSLNPVDCILKGFSTSWLGAKHKVIGGDFAGVVAKAGSETGFKEGEKIYGDVLNLVKRGSCSEYILFDIKKAIILERIPEGMKFEEAASLPIVSGTAYQCLNNHEGLEGKNVLVLGAGTSVGTFTVELAKHYFKAANVVATCSANSKEKIESIGGDVIVDYTKGETSKINQILEFVKVNGKFDIIVDTVRDESVFDYFSSILKPCTEGGVITQVSGSYTIDYTDIRLSQLLPSWKKFSTTWKYKLGLCKFHLVDILLETNPGYGKAIETTFKQGNLKFFIDSKYDAYTEAQKALEKVASGKAKGKVILEF